MMNNHLVGNSRHGDKKKQTFLARMHGKPYIDARMRVYIKGGLAVLALASVRVGRAST